MLRPSWRPRGARGSSWRHNLPAFLTESDLPQSIAARRQAYDEVLDKTWGQEWAASSWFARLHRIDPTMPSNRFQKVTLELNRQQTSIVVQLHMGHVPLMKYLSCMGKVDSPTCPSCQQEEESVHHYIFECPTWNYERWFLGRSLGRFAKSADQVLGTQKEITELLNYVGRMVSRIITASILHFKVHTTYCLRLLTATST